MTLTKSAELVRQAEQSKGARITESLESFTALRRRLQTDSASDLLQAYSPWAKALQEANLHITVRPEEVSEAAIAYKEVAQHLVSKLHWPDDAISILPQGSASTKTLIRSPNGGQKFDIDAVCQVDISRIAAKDPMRFFQSVGDALEELEAEAKKRCWNIPFPNRPFYLEFTPSVPLSTISQPTLDSMTPKYSAAPAYRETALAVVDTPSQRWKTSNPAGMTQWVDSTSQQQLIRQIALEGVAFAKAAADVAPVPNQEVEITDTLRVAIRLFKRHRDMCARRGLIASDMRPISIIIVTLLTSCYEGLAQLGRSYAHPVELLDELASFMPHLIEVRGGQYFVDNPTVEGENFAEKWNDDDGARYRAFTTWCKVLSADLQTILALTDPQAISKRVREVFGIPAPTTYDAEPSSSLYKAPPATPPGRGLA